MWTLIIIAALNGAIAIDHIEFMEEHLCHAAEKLLNKDMDAYCIKTIDP